MSLLASRLIVHRFRDFLDGARIDLRTLTATDVAMFRRGERVRNRALRAKLVRHLERLHARGHIDFPNIGKRG